MSNTDYIELRDKLHREFQDALNELHILEEEEHKCEISDVSRVGLYGLTYKEDVDDCRESPTLQLLSSQRHHLADPLKVYDPMVEADIVDNQYHDFDEFLNDIDMIVIMVGHSEIRRGIERIKDKVVLDTRNIAQSDFYHL